MIQVDKTGVHAAHCCLIHGCKYGAMSKDPCPVQQGIIKQQYRCMYCDDDWLSWGSPQCAAAGCTRPGYWRWQGKAQGTMLALIAVQVLFCLCDGHDEWHRTEKRQYFTAKPMEKRIL